MNSNLLRLAALAAALTFAAPPGTYAATPKGFQPSVSLDVSLTCVHLKQSARDTLNQTNPGLGVTYNFARDWSASAGLHRNSLRRNSVYALAAWTPLHCHVTPTWRVEAGGEAGVLTGYSRADNPAAPFGAAVLLRLRDKGGYGANVVVVPNHGASAGFVGFQFVVPLGRGGAL